VEVSLTCVIILALKLADATALESWLEILPCLIFDEHPAPADLHVCEAPVVSCTIKCGPTASNFARVASIILCKADGGLTGIEAE